MNTMSCNTEGSSKKLIRSVSALMIAVLIASAFVMLAACEDDKGEQGEQGPPGSSQAITVPDDVEAIQEAIDSLPSEGGSIFIRAGTYIVSQGIHVRRSNVTILGEQGTYIKLGDSVNEPVFLVGSDEETPTGIIENIRISNIEIDGNKGSQSSELDHGRPWIRNNGIDVRMVHDLWISGIDVHNARSGGLVVSWNSCRIFVDNSSFHNNFFDGVALYSSEDIQVSSFLCYENNAAGLSLDNELKDVMFSDGSIENNGDVGIFARNSEDISFHSLYISDNQSHGCFLSHETVGTNTGVTRLFFDSCSFIDNDGYGLWLASTVDDSPNNAVIGCLFSGNTLAPINIDPGGQLDQEGNVFQ